MSAISVSPIATRFAWKEYRTLRSFWLAAFVIAAALQGLSVTLAPARPQSAYAETVFAIALAAAALYAAGVAATTFSMEHEEETYGYLSGLPTRWLPLFAGKLSFAALSSAALALALVTTGWLLTGDLPNQRETLTTVGVFGFAIVEMLLWGTFFSLLVRQPLLAALLTIGAESLALTMAVNFFSTQNLPALTPSSYVQVIPTRLAIAVCLFAVDVLLARRWLTSQTRRVATSVELAAEPAAPYLHLHTIIRYAAIPFVFLGQRFQPKVLSHLLWQAWRQSRKPMLAMTVIVPLVCFATLLIFGAGRWDAELRGDQIAPVFFLIALSAAALYWSVVFHADQRTQKYRFLAEHAAWPRYVWFTRLAVWSLPVLLALAVAAVFLAYGLFDVNDEWRRMFENSRGSNHWYDAEYLFERWNEADAFAHGLVFGLWGGLVGAALGQACSMFFRRALVAGFAALVLALPLFVWGATVWAWELAPVVFLLPVALGLVAATWLRAPDWLVDRNSFTAWLKVVVAVALPIAFVAWRLPAAREVPGGFPREAVWVIRDALGDNIVEDIRLYDPNLIVGGWVANSSIANSKEQQATADRLVRLGESIEYPPSRKSTGLEIYDEMGMGSEMELGGEMGLGKSEPSRQEDPGAYIRELVSSNHSLLEEASEVAQQDFRFSVSDASFNAVIRLFYLLSEAGRIATLDGELDKALDYNIAALTIRDRLRLGKSTDSSFSRSEIWPVHIDNWATAEGQTSERVRRAIDRLDVVYPPVGEFRPGGQSVESIQSWSPPPQILATNESLRDVLTGKEPSGLLGEHTPLGNYAAVIANDLPFERERALKTLDLLTIVDAALWRGTIWYANQQVLQGWSQDTIRNRGESGIDDIGESLRRSINLAYRLSPGLVDDGRWRQGLADSTSPPYSWLRTSFLLRKELARRRSFGDWLASIVDREVAAWGLRQKLALVAYRLDHGEYPESLDQLVPEYLPFVPIDPYSGRPFEYRPDGLPHELRQYGSSQQIDPHTSLLWSVGVDDGRLQKRFEIYEDDAEADSFRALRVQHDYYVFESQRDRRPSQPLVFPLPK